MAGNLIPRADTFHRQDADMGYRVAWKSKYGFEKGHYDDELNYGEARQRAEALQAKEPEKVFWAELLFDPNF